MQQLVVFAGLFATALCICFVALNSRKRRFQSVLANLREIDCLSDFTSAPNCDARSTFTTEYVTNIVKKVSDERLEKTTGEEYESVTVFETTGNFTSRGHGFWILFLIEKPIGTYHFEVTSLPHRTYFESQRVPLELPEVFNEKFTVRGNVPTYLSRLLNDALDLILELEPVNIEVCPTRILVYKNLEDIDDRSLTNQIRLGRRLEKLIKEMGS